MDELKPCPFCGGEAQLIKSRFVERGAFVGCIRCLATAKRYRTDAEAIEAWNTRHERTCELIKHAARDEESGIELVLYECGQCGWIVDPSRNERYCPNCGARVIS